MSERRAENGLLESEIGARRERVLRAADIPVESGDADFDALATRHLLEAMKRVLPPANGGAA